MEFLSTPSARRATVSLVKLFFCHKISIHALREEGDSPQIFWNSCRMNFYPRPPRGGRPDGGIWKLEAKKFLSTPSARRATSRSGNELHPTQFLSTPSARRATLAGFVDLSGYVEFLSTPSARRAT